MELVNGYAWEIFLIPIAVMIISQSIKIALYSRTVNAAVLEFNRYGGMPSSHTALFVSLTLIIGLTVGFTTPLFLAIFFVAVVFIRDAVGIRWQLGFHGKILNKLIEELPEEERAEYPKHLEERLGHTPLEATAGGILGLILTLLFHWFVNSGIM